MTVRFGPRMPKDEDKNGLSTIAHTLIDERHRHHLLLVVVKCESITEDADSGEKSPMVRALRVEVVPTDMLKEGAALLDRAIMSRRGSDTLPFEDQGDTFELLNPGQQMVDREREDMPLNAADYEAAEAAKTKRKAARKAVPDPFKPHVVPDPEF